MRSVTYRRDLRGRAWISPILVWAGWGAMTVAAILFIRHYSRNIPYMDDFSLVPIVTGNKPVSLQWLWSLHNEHRPVISRLIIVGLYRFIACDFRLGLYVNAALLSAAAASMIVLVRKLRGHTSVLDVALPLSIFNIGQAETLLIGFAMNLTLTSWMLCELIGLASAPNSRLGWPLSLRLGLYLVLLPLCGGSGLVLLPPLVLWLACESIWGRTGRGDPVRAKVARSVGLGLLIVCLAVISLYMFGYKRPVHHHAPPTLAAASLTVLEYLSLVIWPNVHDHWRLAGWIVVFLVAATLARLCWVGWRQPEERPRAFAMVAVILAMLCAALAVGVTRAFMGPGGGRASRYVTTTAPLFCALYVAWLAHGFAQARSLIQAACGLIVIAIPANFKFGREYDVLGEDGLHQARTKSMKTHSPLLAVVKEPGPSCPSQNLIDKSFKMLRTPASATLEILWKAPPTWRGPDRFKSDPIAEGHPERLGCALSRLV